MELRRSLARTRGDFVAAVSAYRATIGLRAIEVSGWLDFGHLQTFYRSRCNVRTQRVFNHLEVSFQVVEKRSTNSAKFAAEAAWFEAIPPRMRLYTPAFLGRTSGVTGSSYALEYLPEPLAARTVRIRRARW